MVTLHRTSAAEASVIGEVFVQPGISRSGGIDFTFTMVASRSLMGQTIRSGRGGGRTSDANGSEEAVREGTQVHEAPRKDTRLFVGERLTYLLGMTSLPQYDRVR